MDQPAAPDASLAVQPAETTPTAVVAPPQTPFMHRVFIGDEGLRSGWSLLLYLLIGAAILFALGLLLQLAHVNRLPEVWGFLSAELLQMTAVLAPGFIMAKLEKRSFGVYGLPRQQAFGRFFWLGAAWGVGAISILMLFLRGAGVFYFGGLALHGFRIAEFAVFWAVFMLVVAVFEEFLLRGYSQFTLTRGLGFWPAAGVLSTLFGAGHLGNKGEAWRGILAAALIGLFFCLTLRRTGSLWFAVGFHAAWNWGETYVYSVANSGFVAPGQLLKSSSRGPAWLTGGSVGPEGSALVFLVMALMWVVFHFMYPQKKYPAV